MADNLTSKSTELHGPVVLVDGSSYLFRAFYALPDLRSSSGHPTGAIRGVISMLRRLAKDYPNSPLAVVSMLRAKHSATICSQNTKPTGAPCQTICVIRSRQFMK